MVESPSTEEKEGVGLACLFFPRALEEGRSRCMRTPGRLGAETEEEFQVFARGKGVGEILYSFLIESPAYIQEVILGRMAVKNMIDQHDHDNTKILFITKSPFAQTSVRGFQI
jgi:hypothetical protein